VPLFSSDGLSSADTDLTGCWDDDAAATLGADYRATDLGKLAESHPPVAALLADHGHFLHRRSQVADPAVFHILAQAAPPTEATMTAAADSEANLSRLTTPASARHPEMFLPHPLHERALSHHKPQALARVVDGELDAYAALTATLSAATLRLPVAAAAVEWSDAHRAAAAAAAGALGDAPAMGAMDSLESTRTESLHALLGTSLGAARSLESNPGVALSQALGDLPKGAREQLDAFVPRFQTRAPEVLAGAPSLAAACFPTVQSDMLRTLQGAIHQSGQVEKNKNENENNEKDAKNATAAAAETDRGVTPSSSLPRSRRLLGGVSRSLAARTEADGCPPMTTPFEPPSPRRSTATRRAGSTHWAAMETSPLSVFFHPSPPPPPQFSVAPPPPLPPQPPPQPP
jgi:hypothetical protein